MENTVTISIDEYRELIETSNSYDDLLDSNGEAKKEINKLYERIDVLKDIILEKFIDEYFLEYYDLEQLTNISSMGNFPFNYYDLKRASISVEYAMNWIVNKKKQLSEVNKNEQ